MTWKLKAQRGAFAMVIVGALAAASGAGWWDQLCSLISFVLS